MKFEFDVDLEELDYYHSYDFKQAVMEAAIDRVVSEVYNDTDTNIDKLYNLITSGVKKTIKEREDEIAEKVVERVSNDISRKRMIVEATPKASELSKINKENEKYFMELIDKAIAKKFK